MEFYASFVVILVTYLCMCLRTSCGRPPNIVFVLTDDQDVEIGGMVSTSLMPVIAWKCLYWERWVRAAGSQLALPTVFMPRWLHSSITPSLFYSRLKTHSFNGPFSGTTQVSRYQKGKTNLDFTEARGSECQWHQLGHMQVCTSLQTDNHASTHHSVFYRPDALPAAQPA